MVVATSTTPRGGEYLDTVGFYNPRGKDAELRIDLARVDEWLAKGADMSDTAASLVKKARKGSADGMIIRTGSAAETASAGEAAAPKTSARTSSAAPVAETQAPAVTEAAAETDAPAAETEASADETAAPAEETGEPAEG